MVDLAAATCGDEEDVVPIDESRTKVATAMANAVAEVTGECTGLGTGRVSIQGTSRAEIRAEAVGRASAGILANSSVCGTCTAELDSLVTTVETVAAEAVAQANLQFDVRGLTSSRCRNTSNKPVTCCMSACTVYPGIAPLVLVLTMPPACKAPHSHMRNEYSDCQEPT